MTLKENRRKKVPIENPEVLFAQVLFYPSSENSMGLHMFPFCPAIDPALEEKKHGYQVSVSTIQRWKKKEES